MPTVDAYRRAPLANPAFVALSDGALQLGGLHGEMTERVLAMAEAAEMTPLDAVLASKLGGYADLPPVPDLLTAAVLRENPRGFVLLARAALMTAAANRDKDALLRVLDAARVFSDALPGISQERLLPFGADALRLASELYRRTGAPFLLTLLESLRARLPDVAGLLHSFPFLKAYTPPSVKGMSGDTAAYHHRMEMLATGSVMADALAMTAYLALFSGSSRDGAAAKAGLASLTRYHGMPTGAFSADPFLAGRDPARATDIAALCAQVEALADLLMASGDLTFADRLEQLVYNALPDLLTPEGIRPLQPMNRLATDDSCKPVSPERREMSALLRALYAVRRSLWVAKEKDEIALLMILDGGCLTRINGVPVRLTAKTSGMARKTVTITVETARPVSFALHIRMPGHMTEAGLSVNGSRAQSVRTGELLGIKRTFQNGDTITLSMTAMPRWEVGYHGSLAVLCGSYLMALPLPEADSDWQFALIGNSALALEEENGRLQVVAPGTRVPGWQAQNGFMTPPPQGTVVDQEYRLTLLPFAGTTGRVAEFPNAARRP